MKKVITALVIALFLITFASAICNPKVSLVNQDPYPAIPGEYVKLVFQVNNISDPDCETLTLELAEKYPLIFDNDFNPKTTVEAGFYKRSFSSFLIAPYKVRVDANALEGDNPIETNYYQAPSFKVTNEFNLYIEDTKADFEVHIDKYSYETKELTIEILNIADTDVEALTIEIPKQENIEIIGTNRIVVGDLDSNEYSTADFEANPKEGEIEVKILYTDQTSQRRETTKTINFDPTYFENTKVSGKVGFGTYLIVILLIGGFAWWFFKRKKNKSKQRQSRRGSARLS